MRKCAITMESEIPENEIKVLLSQLSALAFGGRHLEVGTAAGGTLREICTLYRSINEQIPEFWVVDPLKYFPNQFSVIEKNLSNKNIDIGNIRFLKSKSSDALQIASLEKPCFDFVLIDGSHKESYVTEDLMWSRFLNVGGLLCAHDYSIEFPGVYRSVNKFLKNYKNYEVVFLEGTLIGIKKVSKTITQEISINMRISSTIHGFITQLLTSVRKRIPLN